MFDKLIDWLLEIYDQIVPFVVIPHYKKAVRLRLGIPIEDLNPGFHWKIPFADDIPDMMVKAKTINLPVQNITTKDGVSVLANAIIKYEVEDIRKALMEVNDPVDAISDMVQGIIRDKIIEKDWIDCNTPKLVAEISRASKAEAKRWGLTILEITLAGLIKVDYVRFLSPTE